MFRDDYISFLDEDCWVYRQEHHLLLNIHSSRKVLETYFSINPFLLYSSVVTSLFESAHDLSLAQLYLKI